MSSLIKKITNMSKTDMAAAVILFAVFIYRIITAFFNGTSSDEAFYITIPLRLINGDGLFTDEWHLSQLSAVLTYLPVKLFHAITGGTQGIIIYMRLLFCFMLIFTGSVIYNTLKREKIAAMIISISYMLYSVISINTLSYNTMGIALLMLLICTAYSVTEKPSTVKMLLSGSLLAMFILCQPLGLIFYAIYVIAVCVFFILFRKEPKKTPYPFTVKSFLLNVAGILPVFIFFLYLLLKSSRIEAIINCIPGILNDVEHMTVSETLGIETFSFLQFFNDMTMAAGIIPLIFLLICAVISKIIDRFSHTAAIYISLSALFVFIAVIICCLLIPGLWKECDDANFLYLPVALSGIPFFLIGRNKKPRVFVLLWCTGFLYAVMMTVTSNIGLHASTNGYIISAFASLIFIKDLLCELKSPENKCPEILRKSISVFCIVVFSFIACSPFIGFVASRSTYKSAILRNGAYTGIYLPSDEALIAHQIYKDTLEINAIINESDRVFVVENAPVAYLDGEFNIGAHSGWFIADQLSYPEIRNRFRNYYELNPDNIPQYIYVPSYTFTEFGLKNIAPKLLANFAYTLFEGESQNLTNGVLIKVTGIKDEQA